jgi:tetratricopeptide (TPR) repeat protein
MAENPRIEELRRRVQLDPASIAFAALAEEFRRMGRHEEAIETCRAGLQRHPAYLSARVTLGRALIEVGDYDAAREELETVLRSAPENLAAIRGLAQIHERQGHSTEMDPHLAELMNAEVERVALAAAARPPSPPPPEPEPEPPPIAVASIEPEPIVIDLPSPEPAPAEPEPVVAAIDEPFIVKGGPDPATLATLARLERFLAAIESARHA